MGNISRKKKTQTPRLRWSFIISTAVEQDTWSGFLSSLWVGPAGTQRQSSKPFPAKLRACMYILLLLFSAEKLNRILSPISYRSSKRLRAMACSSVENLPLPQEIKPYNKRCDETSLINNSKAACYRRCHPTCWRSSVLIIIWFHHQTGWVPQYSAKARSCICLSGYVKIVLFFHCQYH